MHRLKRFHLVLLLALAVGWIVRDIVGEKSMDFLPSAHAQGIHVYNETTKDFTLFTVGVQGNAITAWHFRGTGISSGDLPKLVASKTYQAGY